ncbi:MAG: N-acetylmuramoyl-L-alanine amidase [Reinekea sp.]|nr:N-acetylmuramoyl-L-alanine amidase [Reinekea sp.]
MIRACLICLLVCCSWVQAATIDGVRIWPAPDNTRLVFDLDAPASHNIFILKNPTRIVLDIEKTALKTDLTELDLTDTGISRIRSAVHNGADIRVVLDMTESMSPKSFALPPNDQYGHRLVVDLERPTLVSIAGKTTVEPTVSKTIDQYNTQKRDIIVVIDAGHGGEDPGAIGPTKLREKNVVLAMAKEVYAQLEATKGFKPILVREGDYIVALKKRRDFAREKNADLFVSIHADAFHKSSANGASVYALSNGGVVSAVAKYLADQENAADVIGGINGVSLEDKDDVLKSVLVDLSMTATLQRSLSVGNLVLEEMSKFAKLHGNKKKVGQANFVVLRAPDVPSILVETGFISNPTEEKNLGSPAYRAKMASAIRDGIVRYFEKSPPEGSYIAWLQQQKGTVKKYTVARGDTLSGIASKNGVSVIQLISLNKLNSSTIRVGQVLLIPDA